jgi:hypothetical protein
MMEAITIEKKASGEQKDTQKQLKHDGEEDKRHVYANSKQKQQPKFGCFSQHLSQFILSELIITSCAYSTTCRSVLCGAFTF